MSLNIGSDLLRIPELGAFLQIARQTAMYTENGIEPDNHDLSSTLATQARIVPSIEVSLKTSLSGELVDFAQRHRGESRVLKIGT